MLAAIVGKLDATAHAVQEAGRRALVVEADVTDEQAVKNACGRVLAEFGRADILFNNAGITSPKLLADMPLDEWRRITDVNMTGAFLCSRAFAEPMTKRRHGRIINMGSILSGRGMATRTAYCASKAGLANFGAALAFELGPSGITVNTIGATVIVTDLNRELVRTQPQLYQRVRDRSAHRQARRGRGRGRRFGVSRVSRRAFYHRPDDLCRRRLHRRVRGRACSSRS